MASLIQETNNNDPDTQLVRRLLWEEVRNCTGMGYSSPSNLSGYLSSPLQLRPSCNLMVLLLHHLPLDFQHQQHQTPEAASAGFVGPPDLASWRQRLFQLNGGETVTLSLEQWQQYWPFVSNLWTRNSAYTSTRKQTTRSHWSWFHPSKPKSDCDYHLWKFHGCPTGYRVFLSAGPGTQYFVELICSAGLHQMTFLPAPSGGNSNDCAWFVFASTCMHYFLSRGCSRMANTAATAQGTGLQSLPR
jgi:hypothetical protein